MKKLVSFLPFVALFMLLLLFYPAVSTFGWKSSGDVYVLFDFFSSLIAITAGIFILLHFFTTGSIFFLTISIGFVLMGTEELIHSIFAFNGIWSITDPNFKLTISITWLTGNIIILISFFIALLFRDRNIVPAKRGRYAVVFNIIGFICVSSLTLIIFISPLLSYFVQLDSFSNKLIELSLALLFFTAFLIYFNKY